MGKQFDKLLSVFQKEIKSQIRRILFLKYNSSRVLSRATIEAAVVPSSTPCPMPHFTTRLTYTRLTP